MLKDFVQEYSVGLATPKFLTFFALYPKAGSISNGGINTGNTAVVVLTDVWGEIMQSMN